MTLNFCFLTVIVFVIICIGETHELHFRDIQKSCCKTGFVQIKKLHFTFLYF